MYEDELLKLIGIRYSIDFRHVPRALFNAPSAMLGALLYGDAPQLFATIYNDAYQGQKTFTASDFTVSRFMDEDDLVFFVDLPDEHEGAMTWCHAYGFAFVREGDAMSTQFFTVESAENGPNKLCGVDKWLDHRDFGYALGTDKDNALKMLAIAKKNDALNKDSQIDF
jgi:hypothetical protein